MLSVMRHLNSLNYNMNDVCRFSRDHVVGCSERIVLSCLEPVCFMLATFLEILLPLSDDGEVFPDKSPT